jgi:hypothetical protein
MWIKETQTDKVDLPEDEPETVKLLIQYLYEGEYEPFLPPVAPPASTVVVSTPDKRKKSSSKNMEYNFVFPHTCYDRYGDCGNPRLCPHHHCGNDCNYACIRFVCTVCTTPALTGSSSQLLTHSKIYEVAEKYEVTGLKELAREKFNRGCKLFWNTSDFHIAARHAFSTTPENDGGLRNLVSRTIAEHIQLAQKPEIRTLLMQFNGLALGVLDAKSEELGWNVKAQDES